MPWQHPEMWAGRGLNRKTQCQIKPDRAVARPLGCRIETRLDARCLTAREIPSSNALFLDEFLPTQMLLPLISPSRLLQSRKGHAAREANLILDRTGRKFWQAECTSGSGLPLT